MKKTHVVLLPLLTLLAAGGPADAAEAKQAFSHETLWLLKQVGAPAPSPDGRWVVVPVTEPAYDEKDESADLWIVPGDGSEPPRRLATAKGKESSPAWSPDGTQVAFGAKREGDVQTHLFVMPADSSAPARDVLAVTKLVQYPGYRGAFGEGASDDLQPAWAPDSQSIVFTATTNVDSAAYAEVLHHLYEVNLGSGEPRPLTSGGVSHEKAAFSPDGKRICFTTTAEKGNYYALSRLASAPWPWKGTVTSVAPAFDRSVADFAFSPDSQTVYFSAEDAGHIRVWSAPASGGEARIAVDAPQGVWLSLSIPDKAATPLLFANWEAAHSPAESYRVDLGSGRIRSRADGITTCSHSPVTSCS